MSSGGRARSAPADVSRVALVTGGSSGIGRAVCERLAEAGHSIAVNFHEETQQSDADAVVENIAAMGRTAISVRADVSDASAVQRAIDQVTEALGPPTVLVNNAAITQVHKPWTEVTEHEWDAVMATNTKGAFLCARAVHEHMIAEQWGRVVNVSSVTFFLGRPDLTHYVASKGGLIGFTRSLARSLGPFGVTVNSVSPGAIETEMERAVVRQGQDEVLATLKSVQAIPRRGVAADVAAAVAFFVSEEASFVTGQTLGVDGGWVMR